MNWWRRVHLWPARIRWPGKLLALLVVTVATLFPDPARLGTLLSRLGRLDSLIRPDEPGLAELEARVRASLPQNASAADALPVVEAAVYERLPYSHDWQTWGVMEYVPTPGEALAAGREDCDGRAVVAASLLRRLGYEAWLVSDMLHMWVETPAGETMSPGTGDKSLAAGRPGSSGTASSLNLALAGNILRGTTYGVSVFPLVREIVLLAAICALTLHPWSSLWRRMAGCVLAVAAFALLRYAGHDAAVLQEPAAVLLSRVGWGLFVVAWLMLAVRGRAPRPGFGSVPAESPAAGDARPG